MGNPSPTQGRSGDFRIIPVPRRKGHRSKFPHRIQRKRHQHRRTMQGGVLMDIRREQWTIQGGVKGRTILSGGDQTIGQSPLVVHATMNAQRPSTASAGMAGGGDSYLWVRRYNHDMRVNTTIRCCENETNRDCNCGCARHNNGCGAGGIDNGDCE